jgi:hypothetical protein
MEYSLAGVFLALLALVVAFKVEAVRWRTFRAHSGNIQATFREHSGNIQAIFRQYSGNIQAIFREHSGNIQGTLAGGRFPRAPCYGCRFQSAVR